MTATCPSARSQVRVMASVIMQMDLPERRTAIPSLIRLVEDAIRESEGSESRLASENACGNLDHLLGSANREE